MKVLLVWVPFKSEEIYGKLAKSAPLLPPLELAYMASYLLFQKQEVVLVDAQVLGLNFKDIEEIIRREKPDLVGTTTNCPIFSCIYSVYSRALEFVRLVKSIDSNIKTFLSGYHPTISPQEVLSQECLDYIIRGEGEVSLSELCKAIDDRGNLAQICGIGFKRDKELVINEERPFIKDLDILPMPAYHLLPMEKYKFASDTPVPVKGISIRASRGCLFKCYFCPAPGFWKGVMSTHSPKYVISNMNHIFETYQVNRFQFHDDNFGINKEWILKFCNLLLNNKYKFSWECYSRFDLLQEEVLQKMKQAGCRLISLGVESGSDEILKQVKGFSTEKIDEGMKLLRKIKIKSRLFFMIGPPSKSKKDIDDTIEYAIRLNPDVFHATVSVPYPGSKFYEDIKKNKLAVNFKERLYSIYETPCDIGGFKKEYLNDMIRVAYRRFYLRPQYIFGRMFNISTIKNIKYYLKGLKYVLWG